jgi:prefoldin subunit 5
VKFLALLFLCGCTVYPTQEDRKRIDALTSELRAMNEQLEEYKDRIDRLNRALEAMTRIKTK